MFFDQLTLSLLIIRHHGDEMNEEATTHILDSLFIVLPNANLHRDTTTDIHSQIRHIHLALIRRRPTGGELFTLDTRPLCVFFSNECQFRVTFPCQRRGDIGKLLFTITPYCASFVMRNCSKLTFKHSRLEPHQEKSLPTYAQRKV